jgi:hypothetical protein
VSVKTVLSEKPYCCLVPPCFCRAEETVLRLCVGPDMKQLVLCTETAEEREEWAGRIREAMESRLGTGTVMQPEQQAENKSEARLGQFWRSSG